MLEELFDEFRFRLSVEKETRRKNVLDRFDEIEVNQIQLGNSFQAFEKSLYEKD